MRLLPMSCFGINYAYFAYFCPVCPALIFSLIIINYNAGQFACLEPEKKNMINLISDISDIYLM